MYRQHASEIVWQACDRLVMETRILERRKQRGSDRGSIQREEILSKGLTFADWRDNPGRSNVDGTYFPPVKQKSEIER